MNTALTTRPPSEVERLLARIAELEADLFATRSDLAGAAADLEQYKAFHRNISESLRRCGERNAELKATIYRMRTGIRGG